MALNSKGLDNPTGANNCWLNSTVQLLWHINAFRRCINRISGHYRCLQEYCIYCHLKTLLSEYEHNDELSIPPDALRDALATSCSQSFKKGNLGDPIEAYKAVLDRLHLQLVKNETDGQCSAAHCVVHRKFSMNILETAECDSCKYNPEIRTSWELSMWLSARNVLSSSNCSLIDILSRRPDSQPCSQPLCKGRWKQKQHLLNYPEIFTLCVGWDTVNSRPDEIAKFFNCLPDRISLSSVFNIRIEEPPRSDLNLVGIVCYYGMHYSLAFRHSSKNVWIYLDDSIVKTIGDTWLQARQRLIKQHQQPCMIVYENPNPTSLDTSGAPKTVEMDVHLSNKLASMTVKDNQLDEHKNSQRLLEEADRQLAQRLDEEEKAEETRRMEIFRTQEAERELSLQRLQSDQEAILQEIKKNNQRKYDDENRRRHINEVPSAVNLIQMDPPPYKFDQSIPFIRPGISPSLPADNPITNPAVSVNASVNEVDLMTDLLGPKKKTSTIKRSNSKHKKNYDKVKLETSRALDSSMVRAPRRASPPIIIPPPQPKSSKSHGVSSVRSGTVGMTTVSESSEGVAQSLTKKKMSESKCKTNLVKIDQIESIRKHGSRNDISSSRESLNDKYGRQSPNTDSTKWDDRFESNDRPISRARPSQLVEMDRASMHNRTLWKKPAGTSSSRTNYAKKEEPLYIDRNVSSHVAPSLLASNLSSPTDGYQPAGTNCRLPTSTNDKDDLINFEETNVDNTKMHHIKKVIGRMDNNINRSFSVGMHKVTNMMNRKKSSENSMPSSTLTASLQLNQQYSQLPKNLASNDKRKTSK